MNEEIEKKLDAIFQALEKANEEFGIIGERFGLVADCLCGICDELDKVVNEVDES